MAEPSAHFEYVPGDKTPWKARVRPCKYGLVRRTEDLEFGGLVPVCSQYARGAARGHACRFSGGLFSWAVGRGRVLPEYTLQSRYLARDGRGLAFTLHPYWRGIGMDMADAAVFETPQPNAIESLTRKLPTSAGFGSDAAVERADPSSAANPILPGRDQRRVPRRSPPRRRCRMGCSI